MKLPWQTTPGEDGEKELISPEDLGKFRAPTTSRNYFIEAMSQLKVMLKRNFILQGRWWKSTVSMTLLAPLVFHLLLFILQQADYAKQLASKPHPEPKSLDGVLACQGRTPSDPCITIMYTPVTEEYTNFMTTFAKLNSPRSGEQEFTIRDTPFTLTDLDTPITTTIDIVGVPDANFIYDYTLKYPNSTGWGVTFNEQNITATTGGDGESSRNIQYQLWFNATQTNNKGDVFGNQILSFVRGLDEAIITNLHDPTATINANIDVNVKDWPTIPPEEASDAIVGALGAVFFFCSEMVIFINVLNQIVTEKELKLRIALEMMGLKPGVFWMANFLSNSVLVLANALVTSILGLVFNFTAFKETNFMVLVFLFFLFGEAMVAFAFFITTLVRRSQVAILIGIFMFVIGLLFQSFVFGNSLFGYIWWENVETIDAGAWKGLIFLPFFNFGKMFLDVTTLTTGRRDPLTRTFIPGDGFPWSQLYEDIRKDLLPTYGNGLQPVVPVPVQSYYFLLMNVGVYYLLTWYFDQVLPNEYGVSRPPWFFLLPSYWGFGKRSTADTEAWLKKTIANSGGIQVDGQDDEVLKEKEATLKNETTECPIKIVNLRKVYKAYFYASKLDKIAVKDTCLSLKEGKLLALLGQNGAGKSTTMNILSGLTPATRGDALVYGYSIASQMSQINDLMGVCPQHDILFDDLTAVEHIQLYAGLKGVPQSEWPKLVEDRLKCVRLWQVRHAQSATYSGGMKRRLSLIISTIGDPKVVFMDEPTTGMDPVNRRHVWSFIENFKDERVIVLTTHSMEEADVLGDRIAIMAHGAIRALGNSISLKAKYGAGYRINLITDNEKSANIKEQVLQRVPGVVVEDESAGALIFQFPNESKPSIPGFVDWLEKNRESGIKAWGISQTTLEEVFLRIIRDANPNGYSGYEPKFIEKKNK